MRPLLYRIVLVSLSMLPFVVWGGPVMAHDSSYFPAAVGNSWNYNAQWLGETGSESVVVQNDGTFRSIISLQPTFPVTSKSITAITTYAPCDAPNSGALCVPSTRITIESSMTIILPPPSPPYIMTTTTVTDSTYAPPELWFPASLASNNEETRTSTHTSQVSGDGPPATSTSTQEVTIHVYAAESITVPAGTFQAIKIVETIINTENEIPTTTTVEQWFAPGVGLVKSEAYTYDMNPPNQTITQARELTSYSVSQPTTRLLTVSVNGTGAITSSPEGISILSMSSSQGSASFATDSVVELTASLPGYAAVTWSGCTVNAANDKKCSVTMSSDKDVTALTAPVQKAVLIMYDKGYDTLLAAQQALIGDSTIMARDSYDITNEQLLFNAPYTVTLNGGRSPEWETAIGFTTIKGSLKISNGKLIADNIRVRPN